MPKRARKPCAHPGCGALTNTTYCQKHTKARIRNGYARGKTTARGYGAAWRKLREQIMQRDGWLCMVCRAAGRLTPATEVDHIRAKAHGGTDDPANLRAICTQCHRAKTATEGRGGIKV